MSLPITIDFDQHVLALYSSTVGGFAPPNIAVEDNGNTLHLSGNGWTQVSMPISIASNTVLAFDFKSTSQGEIHGIGMDTDQIAPPVSPFSTFKLYGRQAYGLTNFDDYAASAPNWKHYEIPIGQYYTGQQLYLFFANDHDIASPTAESYFSNVTLFNQSPTATDKYADYWKLNQNHSLIQYRYCVDNPKGFEGYGENCWGLTSSYSTRGYAGHSPSEDYSVISPTAALSSFPYTPKESMRFLKFIYAPSRDSLVGKYGPYDAFSFEEHWYLPRYLAIDQGPIPVMIENYRTGMLWKLFMQAPEVKVGLNKLGFEITK